MIRDYVALDLETSGLNPSENQIIEIGMAKVCDGEITETYSRLLNPKEKLSAVQYSDRRNGCSARCLIPPAALKPYRPYNHC